MASAGCPAFIRVNISSTVLHRSIMQGAEDDEDAFTSVTWGNNDDHRPAVLDASSSPPTGGADLLGGPSSHRRVPSSDAHRPTGGLVTGLGALGRQDSNRTLARAANDVEPPSWEGYLLIRVGDSKREMEGSKETYVSYGVRAETNLGHFSRQRTSTRRRFQDFVFLRDNLARDFPACVVAPLPDKHRLEYVRGDRFSQDFIDKRTADLQLFMERICRHPTLQRAQLLRSFLESTEWHVDMHAHNSHPVNGPEGPVGPHSLLDSLSDTLLNAFAKVRKPDERFVEMREELERFEDGVGSTERVIARNRARTAATPLSGDIYAPRLGIDPEDLASDYEELATSIEGLGYLESGITEPLNKFAATLLEFAQLQRTASTKSTDVLLSQLSSLISYAQAHKTVLKLRDQKQLDFEELTDYLSGVVSERDRLASLSSPHGAGHGHGGVRGAGITGYLRDRVDGWRGVDEERTRVERMQRLDGRIGELQNAVTQAHDTSNAFSNEVLRENAIFAMARGEEMREALEGYADGQIDMWTRARDAFDGLIPTLEKIRTE